MQLKWTDPAGADLDQIEAYITEENSPSVAIDVVMRIIDAVERVLPDHPQGGRIGRVKGTRELVVDGVPFIVVYRVLLNQLQILRVLHDTQHWPQA